MFLLRFGFSTKMVMWIDQESFKVMFSTFCIFIFECPSKDMKIFFHFIFIRGLIYSYLEVGIPILEKPNLVAQIQER